MLAAVYKDRLAAKADGASSCNILRMILLSASYRRALALGGNCFHRNQCIIMQQEFARELGEMPLSICSFGVVEPIDGAHLSHEHVCLTDILLHNHTT